MARAIKQPGLVVGFDKSRLNEAPRNGAPICRDGVDEWPNPCSQKPGNAAAIYRRPKCIVRWQGTAKDQTCRATIFRARREGTEKGSLYAIQDRPGHSATLLGQYYDRQHLWSEHG
jgi:hypothetical protein